MSLVTPITAGLCSVLALAACSPSGLNMSQSATHTQAASRPTVHRNPQPKQAYRITMRIDNAPGPFAKMLGLAQFDVVNTECLRPPKDNPGGYSSPVPTDAAEIPLTQVNDNTWSGVVYADQMLDEEYIPGRGVCHWQLIQAQVQMKATGADGETRFVPNIRRDKILAAEAQTIYFNKRTYPKASMVDYTDDGLESRSMFGPSITDEDLFTVTFHAEKE